MRVFLSALLLALLAPAAGAAEVRDWVHGHFPFLEREWMGMQLWHPIGLLVLLAAGWLVDRLVRVLLRLVTNSLLARGGAAARVERIAFAVRPLGAVAMGLVWYGALPLLELHAGVQNVAQGAIHFVLIIAGIWAAFRIIDFIGEVMETKASETENKLDDVLIPLLRKGAKVAVFLFGIATGLVTLAHADIGAMLTSITIGGVAIGFAAKETVENFFGTLTVILDSPFDIGDYVLIDGKVEGTVEELGFRSTRVRTPTNTVVTVPNATLVRANVENFQRRQFRRWKATLGLTYGTSPEKLLAFTEGVRELIRIHPYTRKDSYQVYANEFSASSLDVLVAVFFVAPDGNTELRERERLMVDIIRLADRLEVSFAHPTRTVIMQKGPETGPADPLPVAAGPHDAKAQMNGITAAHAITNGQPWQSHKPEPCTLTQVKTNPEEFGQ